jgi:hypothetical protein
MKNQHSDQNNACPLDELSPELRPVVEGIVRGMPPEGLMQWVLDGVRRQEPPDSDERPRPLEHRRQRQATPWNFATAAAIGVAVCTMIFFAVSSSLLPVPNPEAIPQTPMALNQDLPTVWAYHRALAESPEAMDALLARHARQILCPASRPFLTHTFPNLLQPMP